jgi:peptide/nickel transport system permease protein
MGRLALDAANGRDYPLVVGIGVVVAVIAVVTSLAVDVLYARLDPRVRLA